MCHVTLGLVTGTGSQAGQGLLLAKMPRVGMCPKIIFISSCFLLLSRHLILKNDRRDLPAFGKNTSLAHVKLKGCSHSSSALLPCAIKKSVLYDFLQRPNLNTMNMQRLA